MKSLFLLIFYFTTFNYSSYCQKVSHIIQGTYNIAPSQYNESVNTGTVEIFYDDNLKLLIASIDLKVEFNKTIRFNSELYNKKTISISKVLRFPNSSVQDGLIRFNFNDLIITEVYQDVRSYNGRIVKEDKQNITVQGDGSISLYPSSYNGRKIAPLDFAFDYGEDDVLGFEFFKESDQQKTASNVNRNINPKPNNPVINQKEKFIGCALSSSQELNNKFKITPTCGNSMIDNAMREEANFMRAKFSVSPSFGYFDDTEYGQNALATPKVENPNFEDGTILLGLNLLKNKYPRAAGGTIIPIILAHEMGHIVDFKYGIMSGETKRKEIFADFIAGTYMYIRTFWKTTDISSCLRVFAELGDTNFGSPDHHGTPQERYNALLAGYNAAKLANQQGNPLSLERAAQLARGYVENNE